MPGNLKKAHRRRCSGRLRLQQAAVIKMDDPSDIDLIIDNKEEEKEFEPVPLHIEDAYPTKEKKEPPKKEKRVIIIDL